MHPAFSVIFLTTLIGLGQGLFLALFTVQSYTLFDLLPAQDSSQFYAMGSAIVVMLLVAGLIASFFHLGRPERAWRAAARWRTSWLSREVIVLPAFMGCVLAYGVAHAVGFKPVLATLPGGLAIDFSLVVGLTGTVLAFALFICTGMIYACLRFLREWHTPLTVINFILMGGASGFVLAAVFAAIVAPDLVRFFANWAAILTLMAFAGRLASLIRNCHLRPKSTVQSAIGIKHPKVVQTSQGFMGSSFNTREFRHGKTAAFLRTIKWFFVVATFIFPVFFLVTGGALNNLLLALVVQYAGLLAERWFFFAQANHPQNLYYQAMG